MAKTECYNCEAEIEVEDDTVVHPLCGECGDGFSAWFEKELEA